MTFLNKGGFCKPFNLVLRTALQRKANLVRRHIRIAEQYIAAVGEGQFPKRDKR